MTPNTLMMLGRLNGAGHVLAAAKHNKRTMYADDATGSDIDATRSHLNYSLAGPDAPDDVVKLWRKLRADVGIVKPGRKNEVSAIEIIFSLPPDTRIDLYEYFTDCTDWAMDRFGGAGSILASDVHLDESAPHCHVLMLPLVDGKMKGSDLYWGGSKNHKLQHDDFHTSVGVRYGLRKQTGRLYGTAKKAAAEQVHDSLRALPSDAQRWASIITALIPCIDRDPGPFMAALGLSPKTRPAKTFKQIALSTGAGPKTEAGQALKDARFSVSTATERQNPMGFEGVPKDQTLSCVGFRQNAQFPAPHAESDSVPANTARKHPPEASDSVQSTPSSSGRGQVTTRHRDDDLTPDTWDDTTGEHVPRRPAPTQGEKEAARAWVANAMAGWSVAV